jgi:hypothetical protein
MQYVTSLLKTCAWLEAEKIPHDVFFLGNESLIPRARNQCAWKALAYGWDQLFFIDADIGWTLEDFKALYISEREVIAGTYPVKTYPIRLAHNPLPFGAKNTQGDETEVLNVPTGFMRINRSVLEQLTEKTEHYTGVDAIHKTKVRMWDLFPSGPTSDGGYASEDYGFCCLVREHFTCGVWLNERVILSHTGTHTFESRKE